MKIILFLLCISQFFIATGQPTKFHFTEQKMGSPFNIVFLEKDSLLAASLANECFLLVDSLVAILSDYDSTSELNKLNASAGNGPMQVSTVLLDILLMSKSAYEKSGHVFDVSIGPLSKIWRKARKTNRFPSKQEVLFAKRLVGFKYVQIDSSNHTVSLLQKGMRLDLGGIAKGYVADQVLALLTKQSISSALVDAGGDISMSLAPLSANGWLIGINVPEQTEELLDQKIQIQQKAVATSGDVYQYFLHNGKKYAHITNPTTGYGVTFQRNVTIIAKDGVTADWLATACSILPITDALELVKKEQAEILLSTMVNNKIQKLTSLGFDKYLIPSKQ